MSIELVILFKYLNLWGPLLLLPWLFPSIRVFSKELAFHIRWPKYWNFSFSISPSDEYSGLISFRIYWFDLAVQGALNNLLQHHSLKASILQHSAFFMVELSHLHMTTGIKIAKRSIQFSSVQSLSHVRLFATPWTTAHQAFLSITNSQSLPKLMSIKSVIPSNHLILCHLLFLLPSIFPSIRIFSNESALRMRWPKYWSFSFSIIPSKEHQALISFRMDWLDLLVVQGTLKSLLQHHSSKASILQRSAFFIVQLSHPYITTGKTIALTRWAFVGKVMSLLFHMLSRLVITFLPRSKHLWISWLQSPFAVILEPPQNKVSHCFHCFPIYFPWSDRTGWRNINNLRYADDTILIAES